MGEDRKEDFVDETIAYVAIRRLQRRYADVVTRRAWAEFEELFRPDCVVTVDVLDRQLELEGPRAIGAFIGGQLEQYDFFQFVILNTVMEIDAPAGRAGARMYIQEVRQNVSDSRRSDTFGVYHDRFERDGEGRWWFARRHYRSWARTNPPGADSDLSVFELSTREL